MVTPAQYRSMANSENHRLWRDDQKRRSRTPPRMTGSTETVSKHGTTERLCTTVRSAKVHESEVPNGRRVGQKDGQLINHGSAPAVSPQQDAAEDHLEVVRGALTEQPERETSKEASNIEQKTTPLGPVTQLIGSQSSDDSRKSRSSQKTLSPDATEFVSQGTLLDDGTVSPLKPNAQPFTPHRECSRLFQLRKDRQHSAKHSVPCCVMHRPVYAFARKQ